VDILIVDDDPSTRGLLRHLLENEGYSVAEAGDGLQAVEMARQRRPQCILLDLGMPGLDGFAVARALRQDPRTHATHIHVLTGRTDDASREQALQAGYETYLAKPFDPAQILDLARHRVRRGLAGAARPGGADSGGVLDQPPGNAPQPPNQYGEDARENAAARRWETAASPRRMLAHLGSRATDRKLRLFACACCRQVWHLLTDECSRRAVEVAERHAEGECSGDELAAAWSVALAFARRHAMGAVRGTAAAAAAAAARPDAHDAARAAAWASAWVVGYATPGKKAARSARRAARGRQAALLRCVFGNPFGPAVRGRRPWGSGAVRQFARMAHDGRRLPSGLLDNAHLSLLADALESAGWTNRVVLEHLRSGGEHVRGCFALDTALGRE
jgi:CheY-like chemotaxis protein